jgi:cell division protein FtsW
MAFFGSSQARRRQGPRGSYDLVLMVTAIALASVGLVMIASSSIAVADGQHIGAFYFLKKHSLFISMGFVVACIAARTELKTLEKHSFLLMLLAVIMLLAVFLPVIGMRINGARRWLNLIITSFQPVEAVKLILVIYLSSYLVRHRDSVEYKLFGVVKPIMVSGLVIVLLLAQPDFGSSALVIAVTVGMIWLAGARMRNLVILGAPLMPAIAWAAMTEDYRMKRLTSFLDPWAHPFDDGFQLTQALIAIGRGEWVGVGLGSSVQKLFYLPEAHTDFILSVIAEELGLAGVLFIIGLFAVLVGRGLYIGLKGVEIGQRFPGYVAFGLSLMIGLQAIVSIGVNLGVLPTKGLTLPLISYGGSSVLLTFAMVGVLLRATFEINRALDARQMATRMPGVGAPDGVIQAEAA